MIEWVVGIDSWTILQFCGIVALLFLDFSPIAMNRFISVSFLSAVLFLSACTSQRMMEGSYSGGAPVPAMMVESKSMMDSSSYSSYGSYESVVSSTDRQVIKTANVSLHVESVQTSVTDIEKLVTDAGGSVSYSTLNRGDKSYTAYMTVKVPAEKLDPTMTALKALALYVESEDSNSSDVTDQYVDLQAHLVNKQAEEKQYLDILAKTTNMTDVLAATQALSNVRYEIEGLQTQIKSYDTQIDQSSINISLSENDSAASVVEKWAPSGTVQEALSNWVAFLQSGVNALIYAVIFGWPLILIGFIVWGVWKKRKAGKRN